MSVFAVIQTRHDERVEEKIASHPHLKIREGVWLIAADGTAQDVAGSLGILEDQGLSAIILKPSSYHGRTSTSTWDWLKAHWE